MFEKKIRLTFTHDEKKLLIASLNQLRTDLIQQGRYTDCVDELLTKIFNCKSK